MTFEEMNTYKVEVAYDHMKLRVRSWKQMYTAMMSSSYRRSYVSRPETGVVNTIMNGHVVGDLRERIARTPL